MTEKEKLIGEMNSLVDWLPDSVDYIPQCWEKIKNLFERSDNRDYAVPPMASHKSCPKCQCKELEDTFKLSPHKKCCDCGHDFA